MSGGEKFLEGIFKGLLQWVYDLILEIVEYIANLLAITPGLYPVHFWTIGGSIHIEAAQVGLYSLHRTLACL